MPPASPTPRSEAQEINPNYYAGTAHRGELLCSFMGDMVAIRNQKRGDHLPIMLSWSQAQAIEAFLMIEGYSAWGYSPPATGHQEPKAA